MRKTRASIGLADCHCRQQLRRAAIARDIIDVDLGTAPAVVAVVRSQQLAALVHLQRFPRVQHRGRRQVAGRRRLIRFGDVDHGRTQVGPVCRAERRAVVGADVVVLVPKLGRLPVGAIAPALAHQLKVAVETLEAGRAQSRRHLALQACLGVIVLAARGLGNGERSGRIALLMLVTGGPAAERR